MRIYKTDKENIRIIFLIKDWNKYTVTLFKKNTKTNLKK